MTATNAMMQEVKGVVVMYARRYAQQAPAHIGYDDLCQLGYCAAMRAAETYNAGAGASYATYCRLPVEAAMRAALASWRAPMASLDADGAAEVEADGAAPDVALEAQQRDGLVRGIVDRVVAEHANRTLAEALVTRLMEGEQGCGRYRSGGDSSVRALGARFGVSRQTILVAERRLRAQLAEALAGADL